MPACIRWIYNCTSRAGWTAMFLLAAFLPLSHAEETSFGNTYSTSWVGNTHNEGNTLWMPDWQRSLGVSPDGTVFVAGGSEMDNPLFPAAGPAPGSFNGLNPKSKFLAFKLPLHPHCLKSTPQTQLLKFLSRRNTEAFSIAT